MVTLDLACVYRPCNQPAITQWGILALQALCRWGAEGLEKLKEGDVVY